MKNKQSHIPFLLIAIGFATAIFLSKVGLSALNPLNDQWLMTSGSDWTPDYMAWGFYRNADWSFPLGIFTGYSFPEEVSIGLTGAIPLVAVPLKLFRSFLPEVFQHFGMWLLSCYILQSIFSYRLLRLLGVKDKLLLALGSCIFVISYTLLDRIAHTNLCAQWLILAGLCVYFSPQHKNSWWQHGIIIFASVWTHPYLIIFTISIAFVDFIKLAYAQKIKYTKAILNMILTLAVAIFAWFLIGNHILESDQARGEGFGIFSANLNTFFTPKTDGGIMPALPRYYETQFEGVAYLGIGILASILFFPIIWYKKLSRFPSFNRVNWPIIILAIGMFLFSLSNQVTLNNGLVMYYKLPEWAMDKASILRASGRYVWLIYYLVLSWFVIVLARTEIKKIYKYLWLSAIIGINVLDFWPQIKPNYYTRNITPVVENFDTNFWKEVIGSADDFIMFPAHERNYAKYADDMIFAELAMKEKKKFNSGHLARFNFRLRESYKQAVQDTIETNPLAYSNKTIITSRKYLPVFSNVVQNESHHILEANGYFAFVPKESYFIKNNAEFYTSFIQDTLQLTKENFGVYTQRQEGNYMLISVMDEASNKLKSCPEIYEFFQKSGSKIIDLAFRESYAGIFKDGMVLYEKLGHENSGQAVKIDTSLIFSEGLKKHIELFSADMNNGNEARIFVEQENFAINDRGLNIVTLDEAGDLMESTHFDTYQHCYHDSENSALFYTIWRKK